jgi:3-oxosteroid 1-dehydrogenase
MLERNQSSPAVPSDVSTYGGAVTDLHGRMVKADGAPIEGRYATGVSTASVLGGVYPGGRGRPSGRC